MAMLLFNIKKNQKEVNINLVQDVFADDKFYKILKYNFLTTLEF